MRQRRTFTSEYKAEVVKMVTDSGKSPRATARDLGLTPSAVAGWVRQADVDAKGQVVIPEEVRNRLGLREGAQFIVLGEGGVVILKSIAPPSPQDFTALLEEVQKQARRSKLKKSDVADAGAHVRSKKK